MLNFRKLKQDFSSNLLQEGKQLHEQKKSSCRYFWRGGFGHERRSLRRCQVLQAPYGIKFFLQRKFDGVVWVDISEKFWDIFIRKNNF